MKLNRSLSLLAGLLGMLAASHAAPLLYVSDGTTLSSLDPTNGTVLDTQTLSTPSLRAMTFSSTGVLFGLFDPDFQAKLGIIDPTNGNVTLLAIDTGLFSPTGLAFDSTGGLFGAFGSEIYGLNPGTGAVSGPAVACGVNGDSLAFGSEPSARVIGAGLTFNQVALDGASCGSTGSGSTSGSSSGSGSTASTGSGSGAVLYALRAFTNANGTSFAIGWVSDGSKSLVTFDGSTFSASPVLTELGALSPSVSSIAAFDGGTFAPEPGSIVLLGLGLGGMLLHRRYR